MRQGRVLYVWAAAVGGWADQRGGAGDEKGAGDRGEGLWGGCKAWHSTQS